MASNAETPKSGFGGEFLLRLPERIATPEDFNEQQRMIGATAERFAREEVEPAAEELEKPDLERMRSLLRKAAELGLCAADVPEEYGGLGLGLASSTIIADRIARYGSFSVSFSGHTGIGTLPVLYFGTEEQKRRYLPRLASGEWIGAYALSESGSGSDALAARARAERAGHAYLLNGEKMWTTNAALAGLFTVFAKLEGERFTAFLVERDFPGVTLGAEEEKMGLKGSSTRPLLLNQARVPEANVLGEIGRGHVVAFNILNIGRLKLAAACLGGARTTLADAAGYAVQRRAFGHAIAEFGLVQQMLAAMAADLYACEAAVYRTVGLIEARLATGEGGPAGGALAGEANRAVLPALEAYAAECSLLKVAGSEMLDRAVDANVQLHGGYGYVKGYAAERAFRDARVNRIFEGTNEINRLLISGLMLRRAQKGELALLAAAQAAQQQLLSRRPGAGMDAQAAAGMSGSDFPPARAWLEGARSLWLLLAGGAWQKYRQALAEQQPVLAALSDLMLELYLAQSAGLRAAQASALPQAETHALLGQAALERAAARFESTAKRLAAAIAEGDNWRVLNSARRRLLARDPLDGFTLDAQVASAVLASGRYPIAW